MNWDDREKETTFIPCDYCRAFLDFQGEPNGDNGACKYCDYAIILACLQNNA